MNWELGTVIRVDGVQYFHTKNATKNGAGTHVWVSENGNMYDGHPQDPSTRQLGKIVAESAPTDGPDLTPEKIYEAAIRDNHENLRWWKEGYAEGYATGFDAGREYQLEQ